MKKKRLFKLILLISVIGLLVFIYSKNSTVLSPSNGKSDTEVVEFDKTKYSTKQSDSLWVIVNKQQAMPADFVPKNLVDMRNKYTVNNSNEAQLRSDAFTSLTKMINAAKNSKIPVEIISGYRAYSLQSIIYNDNVTKEGQANADKTSARPGHSEHQTGLAVDINNFESNCRLNVCFGSTKTGKWVASNAHNYGFIVRYQKGTKDVVGFSYEPWHLRYVGKELSSELYKQKATMEEFFGYPAAPDYK